jgi:hypothetical protein
MCLVPIIACVSWISILDFHFGFIYCLFNIDALLYNFHEHLFRCILHITIIKEEPISYITLHMSMICTLSLWSLQPMLSIINVAILIQGVWYKMLHHNTVVIKEWRNIARDVFCWTTCSWHHSIGIRRKRLFNVHSFIFVRYWPVM